MEDKREYVTLKKATEKYGIGIAIIWIIYINIIVFLWGVEISLKSRNAIIGTSDMDKVIEVVMYIIKFALIIIMYRILNKIILNKNKIEQKNVGKLIRNISYINIVFLLITFICITIKLIKIENILPLFILYSFIIEIINIMEGIWINKTLKVEKEVRKSQRKDKIILLVSMTVIILITIVTNISYNHQKLQRILKMEVMLPVSAKDSEIREIKEKLSKIPYIQNIEYSSQENNFEKVQEENNLNGMDDLIDLLPRSFIITVQEKNKDKAEEAINEISDIKKVIVRQEE